MKIISNQNGFTYILALTVVIIMGIMLGMVGQSWETIKQRELEEELIYRGDQVAEIVYQGLLCKNAALPLTAVNQPAVNQPVLNQPAVNQPAVNLNLWLVNSPKGTVIDDLVIGKEERCASGAIRKFRLRASVAIDPMTNKPWQIVTPVGDLTHFYGVRSESKKVPFKRNFKDIYDSELLNDRPTYNDWSFTWELKQQQQPLPQNPIQNPKR
ncbi:MAG TPA: type II secretion system protein [Dongiaceae bacterium]|nr:type II secretion system protein [Dongiaceae bacterium]